LARSAAFSAIAYNKNRRTGQCKAAIWRLRAEESQARIRQLFSRTDGTESMSGLRKEMMDTMEKNCGLYRTEAGLQEAVAKIAELRKRYQKVVLHDKQQCLQHRLVPGSGTRQSMLDCAAALTVGALARKESHVAPTSVWITWSVTTTTSCATAWPTTRARTCPPLTTWTWSSPNRNRACRDYSGGHK
jgi:fumarate reductase flavoprotein subunit